MRWLLHFTVSLLLGKTWRLPSLRILVLLPTGKRLSTMTLRNGSYITASRHAVFAYRSLGWCINSFDGLTGYQARVLVSCLVACLRHMDTELIVEGLGIRGAAGYRSDTEVTSLCSDELRSPCWSLTGHACCMDQELRCRYDFPLSSLHSISTLSI